MASLWKHPESKYWFACFTKADGTRTKRSTKTTERKEAQKLAEQYEEAATKKRTSLHTRRVIQELHASLTGESLVFPSVRDHFEDWLRSKRGEVAKATLVFYSGIVKKFLTWLGPNSDKDLISVTEDELKNFRRHEFETLTAKTVNHEIKTLRMIFGAAKEKKLIVDNPAEFVRTLKEESSAKRRPFSLPEIRSVLAIADKEWRSMILFGLYLGQRLIDIATLRSENIDLNQRVVSLKARKTNRNLQIGISPALLKHLRSFQIAPGKSFPLHPSAWEIVARQGKTGHLSNQFSSLLAKAGLREKKPHRKSGGGRAGNRDKSGLSFHSLRHTAVTLLKEAGIPHAVVQEMIGHESSQMSEHYTHVGAEALKKAADAMPDVTS